MEMELKLEQRQTLFKLLLCSLALLFISSLSLAAERVTLRNGSGNEIGTTTNPINATVSGAVTGAPLTLGSSTGATMNATTGVITVAGTGNTNNENLKIDLEGTSNSAVVTSTTGVTLVNLGTIGVTAGATSATTLAASSTVSFTSTTNIGWSVQVAANQACNTTCTSACIFGEDTSVLGSFVDCADATADRCLCGGAS